MARNRTNLTATFIKSGKLVPARGAVDYRDPDVQGLALRVTQFGHKSYVLIARYPLNPKNPTRRVLGDTDEMTLAEARDAARAWRALIRQGIDPKCDVFPRIRYPHTRKIAVHYSYRLHCHQSSTTRADQFGPLIWIYGLAQYEVMYGAMP
jgi:hypothetical protein